MNPLRAWPGPSSLVAGALCLLIGLTAMLTLMHDASVPADRRLTGALAFGGIWVAFGLLSMTYALLPRIVADEAGLSGRGWFGRSWRARWDEIADYYLDEDAGTASARIALADGKTIRFDPSWSGGKALLERVAERRVGVGAWERRGSRAVDTWPQAFPAADREMRSMRIVAIGGSLAILGMAASQAIPRALQRIEHPENDNGLGWVQLGVYVVVMGLPPLVVIPMLRYRLRGETPGETWTLDEAGITIATRNGPNRRIAWSEITACKAVRGGWGAHYEVHTETDVITFGPLRPRSAVLCDAIARWSGMPWTTIETQSALVASTGSGGRRLFHYRTRTNRAMLWFLGVFVLAPAAQALVAQVVDAGVPISYHSTLAMLPAWLYLWSRYFLARIEVDDDIVRQYALGGIRNLPRSAIVRVERGEPSGFLARTVVHGADGTRITWFTGWLADDAELLRLLT